MDIMELEEIWVARIIRGTEYLCTRNDFKSPLVRGEQNKKQTNIQKKKKKEQIQLKLLTSRVPSMEKICCGSDRFKTTRVKCFLIQCTVKC